MQDLRYAIFKLHSTSNFFDDFGFPCIHLFSPLLLTNLFLFPLHPALLCPLHQLAVQAHPLLVPILRPSYIPLLFLLFVASTMGDSVCPLLVRLLSFPLTPLRCLPHLFPPLLPAIVPEVPVLRPLAQVPPLPGVCWRCLPVELFAGSAFSSGAAGPCAPAPLVVPAC